MASWGFNNRGLNFRGFDDGNEIMMLSRKSGFDLLPNCDLPPPLKVFSGPDKKKLIPGDDDDDEDDGFRLTRRGSDGGGVDEKLELLKALRLSQSRAREAERKAANLAKERDILTDALLRESMRLMAHRQWVKLLEAQVTRLKSQWTCPGCGQSDTDTGTDSLGVTWMVALALCLGIAGVGLAFGCKCMS